MRTRELLALVRKHGSNPVEMPTARDLPQVGAVDFDKKLREYDRWVKEWELCERELKRLKAVQP